MCITASPTSALLSPPNSCQMELEMKTGTENEKEGMGKMLGEFEKKVSCNRKLEIG